MQEILLINPSARPKKRKGTKMAKRRTAAQKRATAKLVAMNRSRRSKSSSSVKRRRKTYRKNPAAPVYVQNAAAPRKRRARTMRVNPSVRRRMRSRTRNPIGGIMPMVKDSAMGAVGAVAVSSLYSFVPLPDMLKMGNMAYVSKGLLAVLFGIVGAKVLPRNIAGKMAAGSLTVTMYEALKDNLGGVVPGLSGVGYFPGGRVAGSVPRMNGRPAPALSEYVNRGMGEYVNRGMGGMTMMDEENCNSIY